MIKRKTGIKPRIFILSNGQLAEPQYFQDFKDHLRAKSINVINSKSYHGKAPWILINKAIEHKKKLKDCGKFVEKDGDQFWCVFDVDNYWNDNPKAFTAAISLAHKHGIRPAWSNECFELWFLCHFTAVTSAIPRNDYHKKLKKFFKEKGLGEYSKNMEHIFSPLLQFHETAVKNAKKLLLKAKVETNPSTSVIKLVEELKKLNN